MRKLILAENGDFSVESQSRRYVLHGCKHGDTAYVSLRDTFAGIIYEVDDIKWDGILLLVRDRMPWKKFL